MKLLVTTFTPFWAREELEKRFDEIRYRGMMQIGRVLNEAELMEAAADVDVILVEFDPLTRRVLENAKNLKVIASVRGGAHANVDVAAANELGIPILYVPGRNQDTVADFTMGLIIDISRGISKGNHLIKTKAITDDRPFHQNGFAAPDINWVGSTPEKFAYLQFKGPTLAGKRLGLVGYGAIARETAKRALAFDMEVVAYDPYVTPKVGDPVQLVSLETLMSTSDFVSVHLPVNDGTRGLISADMLGLMKAEAYLINTARAAVLDYDKLIDMLRNNRIAGAALDVYPMEPLTHLSPLLTLDNVTLTPHIAGCSLEPYDRSYNNLLEDLDRFFREERPLRLYNPEAYGAKAAK